MLGGRRILIAEDEPLVALCLVRAVEDARGEVAGPVSTVRDGLALLAQQDVHAAILDVRLLDRQIVPIARTLFERGKVVVFHTASPIPAEIRAPKGRMLVCPKPMGAETVVVRLAELILAGGR